MKDQQETKTQDDKELSPSEILKQDILSNQGIIKIKI
jgi:hypothetical protein